MKRTKLDAAIAEAQRFLARADRLKAVQIRRDPVVKLSNLDQYLDAGTPRESGALRRASMDLTRALADLRRRDQ